MFQRWVRTWSGQGHMARTLNRLSARTVATATRKGMYADGGGLYLQITATRTKNWVFRFASDGKTRDMGLGALAAVTLADAREAAAECRRLRQKGIDPIEERKAARADAKLAAARSMTFDQCRDAYIAAHKTAWKNAKHRDQ